MKKTIRVQVDQTFDIAFVRISVPVRCDKDDMPNNYPFRKHDWWEVLINADNGEIQDWPEDFDAPLYLDMKVRDRGSYTLLDPQMQTIAKIEQDYVPHGVVPGSYGDYIELDIDANGKIRNWPKSFDLHEFFRED